ncbi:hypothetical protein A7317_21660 [Pseudomonas fluorescens]|jgi:hypothetical protein|nr:hypothetical protein A7317_21660 [Pseudomonas fluorescens]AOE75213.1 hypothetical protein A7319_21085 [Pseudomonas fluorescens]
MFDHSDLHRQGFKLLADLLADSVFAAAARIGQFIPGQFMDDLMQGRSAGSSLRLPIRSGRRNSSLFGGLIDGFYDAFRFIEQG